MRYCSAIYHFGLNSELFNEPVKPCSTLCIQNSNFKHYCDFNTIYLQSNHCLCNKTTRTKRGNSCNKSIISKIKILKNVNLLDDQFIFTFDWTLIRKYRFSIRKKGLATYLNISINNTIHTLQILFMIS